MSDQVAPPPEPEREPAQPAAPPERYRYYWPAWLFGAGFLVLAGALLWVVYYPPETHRDEMLAQQITSLEGKIADLERRPAPQAEPPDLGPLLSRLKALEQRPAPASPPAFDLEPLEARIGALERRPAPAAGAPDLGPLEARVYALEQRKPPDLAPLEARISALEASDRAAQADASHRIDAEAARIDAEAARIDALERTAGHTAQAEAVRIALDAGQPLGTISGAPPTLARFADTAPPTEAQLRLSFPAAAQAAIDAANPARGDQPLLARVWARAQDLVTIRRGDRVLVGNPAAGILARAGKALDAGDLAGAVQAVGSLNGGPAEAMSAWLTRARALLDARAALAAWAARG